MANRLVVGVVEKIASSIPDSLNKQFWRGLTQSHIAIYRASGGRIGSSIGGLPFLVLHHKGRKSGQWRAAPLVYAVVDGDPVIIASKGGAPKNPIWFLNLEASPECEIEIGRERRQVRARVLDGEERSRAWAAAAKVWPGYEGYKKRAPRQIPVILLEPR
jgi:proline iminopeptidase